MGVQQDRKQQQACSLHVQNLRYSGTNGISENNRSGGLIPAFRDEHTGQIECSRLPNGDLAPIHLIASLPADWVDDQKNAMLKPKGTCSGAVIPAKAGIHGSRGLQNRGFPLSRE